MIHNKKAQIKIFIAVLFILLLVPGYLLFVRGAEPDLGPGDLLNSLDDGTLTSSIKFSELFSEKDSIENIGDLEITNDFQKIDSMGVVGVKHNINLRNTNMLSATPLDYSLKIDIKTNEIRWNGTNYRLDSKPQRLQPFYKRDFDGKLTPKLIVPNIFFGENNKRINFQQIGDLGGYALVYNTTVELRIDSININPNTNYYIDPTYYNQTDGFKVSPNFDVGLAKNSTNFFLCDNDGGGDTCAILDLSGNIVYSFTVTTGDSTHFPLGITTDNNYIWVVDYNDNAGILEKYTVGGASQGNEFSNLENQRRVTLKSSNSFYILIDNTITDFVIHYNAVGNFIGQTDITFYGIGNARGITTNGTDFWIIDGDDGWVYHLDSSMNNATGSFEISQHGISNPDGITTNVFVADENGGSPTDFWIYDTADDFIFHLSTSEFPTVAPFVEINFPLNNTFGYTQFVNFTYNVSDADIGDVIDNCTLFLQHEGGAWEANQTNISAITQLINQSINITLNSFGENITWKVGCYDNSSNQGNSTEYNFSSYVAIPITTFISPTNNTHDAFFTCAFINGITDCGFSQFKTYTGTSFTYQTTTPDGNIANCSLWLQHNSGDWELNSTDFSITQGVDQTFDIDLKIDEEVAWLVECTNDANKKANSTANNFSLYEFYDNFINVIDFKTQLSKDIRFLDNATYMFANISTMWELNTNTREVNFTIQNPKGFKLVDNTNGTLNFSLHPYTFASIENRWFATLDPFLVNETGDWEFRIDVRNYGNQTRFVKFNKTIVDTLSITPSNRDFVAISFLNENFTQTITIFQNNTNAELDYNISAFIQSTYHNISFNYTSTSQNALSDGFIYALSTSMRISNTTEYQFIFYLNRTRDSVPDGVYEGNITISRTLEGYEKDFYFNFRVALNPPAANLTFVQFGETALCTSALCDNSSNYAFGDTIKFFYNVQNTGGFDASNCNLNYSGGSLGFFSESGFSIAQGESKNITLIIDQVGTTPPLGYFTGDINIRCDVNSLGHTGNAFNPPVMTLTIISSTESATGGPGGGGGGGVAIVEKVIDVILEIPALLGELEGARPVILVLGGSLAVFLIVTSLSENGGIMGMFKKKKNKK